MEQASGRIVVGMDGSPGGRAALDFALRDAARRGAAVEVVAAFELPEYWAAFYEVPGGLIAGSAVEEVRDALRREIDVMVEEVSAELAGDVGELPPVTVTVVGGGSADALLRASRGADLLVVGSRGRGGFTSMVLGSVSMQCVLHATSPVTIVHPGNVRAADSVPT